MLLDKTNHFFVKGRVNSEWNTRVTLYIIRMFLPVSKKRKKELLSSRLSREKVSIK